MEPDGHSGSAPELQALTARVAQLERQVAELRAGAPVAATLAPNRREAPSPPVPVPLRNAPPVTQLVTPPLAPPLRPSATPSILPPVTPLDARLDATPAAETARPAPLQSLEDRLGSQVFNMVGIFALICGMAYFLKLAIEHGWIDPGMRVLIGLAAGTGLVAWSEAFRRRAMAAFSYSLKAVGTAVLYLSLWASFQLYHLLPGSVALLAMVLVTAWNAWMALGQDAELLAGYAMAGALLTPMLLSTGGNHEAFLFTYLAAIDLGVVVLLRSRRWRWLLLPAFAGTVLYFIGWYSEFFHRGGANAWTAESSETAVFAGAFFAIFALLTVKGWCVTEDPAAPARRAVPVNVLLPLANAVFLALALYSVLQDSGLHDALAWLMVALAALYLGLMQVQRLRVAGAMYLACAVVCLTVAIALKASGHTLTTAWLVEGLVLFWAGTRLEEESAAPSRTLGVLSAGGFALGLASLVAHWWWFGADNDAFLNRNLAAALVALVTLGLTALLAARASRERDRVVPPALLSVAGVGVLLTARELGSMGGSSVHPPFANAAFWTACVGLGVMGAVAWSAARLQKRPELARLDGLAAGATILFHLLTILSVEREISSLWTSAEAGVQRSLALSGFLMAYGAGLLACGFARRTASVRWQGLVLLVFTICKVFLYDIRGLSAGYRVASLMGLGVVLMGVSYAYQKDWLGLKHAPDPAGIEVRS